MRGRRLIAGALLMGGALLTLVVPARAASRTFNFEGPSYGTANDNCVNVPIPPMFNRPEYGSQTAKYVINPVGCAEGAFDGTSGSASYLTSTFPISSNGNDEIRFSFGMVPRNVDGTVMMLNWTDATKTLGATGAFTTYGNNATSFNAGDSVEIISGTGVTPGIYAIASKVSNDALTLTTSITGGTDTTGVIARVLSTNSDAWARVITANASSVSTHFMNPTVDIRDGSSISMKIMVFAYNRDPNQPSSSDEDLGEDTSSGLEVSLGIRETNNNLPLGEDGGTSGAVEFVGLDCVGKDVAHGGTCTGGSAVDVNTPAGGLLITDGSTGGLFAYKTVTWTFGSNDAQVSVDDGSGPVTKNIVGFPGSGNGHLVTSSNRGTLDSLCLRKPVNKSTMKYYVYVDDIVITSPVTDPVQVQGPILAIDNQVTVKSINPDATEVRLYKNLVLVATHTLPGAGASPATSLFTAGDLAATLPFIAGDSLTATQVIGTESDQSAAVIVQSTVIFSENFDSYANQAAFNAVWANQGDQTVPDIILLSTVTAASCPKSALIPGSAGGATANRPIAVAAIPGAAAQGGFDGSDSVPLNMTFWILHDPGTQHRNAVSLESWSGHAYNSGTRRSRLSIGMYNSGTDTSVYNCRALGGSGNWTDMDQGPDGLTGTDKATRQSSKWVKLQISVKTSTVEYSFNGELYKVLTRPNANDKYDTIVIGEGLTNTTSQSWQDNITISFGTPATDAFPAPVVQPTVASPIAAAATSVSVGSVSASATSVKVYGNGILIGTNNSPVSPTTVVTVTPPGDGTIVQATQVIGGVESCLSYSRVTALSQTVGDLLFSLGIREQTGLTPLGPVGETCTVAGAGPIEWIGSSIAGFSAPQGKRISPSPCWQTLTFDPAVDPIRNATGGNGVLNLASGHWAVIEELGISIDPVNPKPGPYTLYIDNISNEDTVNGGKVVFGRFDQIGSGQGIFNQPSFSGTTGSNIAGAPNAASVSTDTADAGTKSDKIQWAFVDTATTRWLRLTTAGTADAQDRSPLVDLTKPVTMRVLLVPNGGLATGPSIQVQPQNVATCSGNSAVFTVTANTTHGTLHYQWLRSDPASNTSIEAPNEVGLPVGTDSPTLTLAGVTAADNGTKVSVNICDDVGNVASSTATLTTAIGITTQPVATTHICPGQIISLSVVATGPPVLHYQWTQDGSTPVGTDSASLPITGGGTGESHTYTVAISSNCTGGGSTTPVTSATATVIVDNCNRTVTAWRSMKTHAGTPLGITLNPTATGNGSTGPTSEPRSGGITRIEMDLDGTATVTNTSGATITDEASVAYPATVSANGANGIAIVPTSALPNQHCYHVVITAGTLSQTIIGDNDVNVRGLVGDTSSNGVVNETDVIYTILNHGAAVNATTARHDIDLSGGTINKATDGQAVKAQVTKPAKQASCP